MRRATALAGAGATIELISVALVADGARRIAQPEQIDDLAAAAVTAAMQGVRAQPHIAGGPTEADAILDGSSGCDLLVIAPGATANELVVRGDVPVLVAVYTGIDGRPDRLPASIAWRSRTPADWAGFRFKNGTATWEGTQ